MIKADERVKQSAVDFNIILSTTARRNYEEGVTLCELWQGRKNNGSAACLKFFVFAGPGLPGVDREWGVGGEGGAGGGGGEAGTGGGGGGVCCLLDPPRQCLLPGWHVNPLRDRTELLSTFSTRA